MRRTDYERIAARYDENEVRKDIAPDDWIASRLRARAGDEPLAVLDVGCGTGNWLVVQTGAYGTSDVRWHAVDRSPAMLARAKAKLGEAVVFAEASAEALPFGDGAFDVVVSTFTFHHFADKARALDEMRRVGRSLRMRNIDVTRMRGWWGYRYFPEARLHDEQRFWSSELVAYELERRGFSVEARVDVRLRRVAVADLLRDAERRDLSQLADLDDDVYARGLGRLRAELARDRAATETDEIALVTWTAT